MESFREYPGPVVLVVFTRERQLSGIRAGAGVEGVSRSGAVVPILPKLSGDEVVREDVVEVEVGAAGAGKVPVPGGVGAFEIVDAFEEFGKEQVQVGVTLTVCVGAHVERHPVEGEREVRAVIEIKAPQEILVGLAPAGVLGDDHARHGLQRLATAHQRTGAQFCATCSALGGGGSDPEEVRTFSRDDNLVHLGGSGFSL